MTQADRLLQSEYLLAIQSLYGDRALPDEPEPTTNQGEPNEPASQE